MKQITTGLLAATIVATSLITSQTPLRQSRNLSAHLFTVLAHTRQPAFLTLMVFLTILTCLTRAMAVSTVSI